MPEISEEDLRTNVALRNAMEQMMSNPESRKLLLKARKTADPKAVIPELEAETSIDARISELTKTVGTFIDTQTAAQKKAADDAEQAKVQSKIDAGFAKLKDAGVTAEGIEGVRKIMEAEGIISPEVAWSHFEKLHPAPAPVTPSGYGAFNFLDQPSDGSEDIKKLIESRGESNQVLDKLAHEALAEIRGQPRR